MVSFYGNAGGEGGGSGGTTNYNDLINKPFINSVGTTSSPIVIQSLESGRYLISGYFKHGTSQTENVEVPAGTKAEVIVGIDTVTGYKVAEYNTFQNGEIIINKILYNQSGALDKIEKINVGAPGEGGQIIQYDTPPAASQDNLGKIIQYTGTTNDNFTNGYFYKCIEKDSVYSWVEIKVSETGSLSTEAAVKEMAERLLEEAGDIDYDRIATDGEIEDTINNLDDI